MHFDNKSKNIFKYMRDLLNFQTSYISDLNKSFLFIKYSNKLFILITYLNKLLIHEKHN